jgi:hypothetical protein
MFDSPVDLMRHDNELARRELEVIDLATGASAVANFLSNDPGFKDYLCLLHHVLNAVTIYNEVIQESATGPNSDEKLAEVAAFSTGALKEMRVAYDNMLERYGYLPSSPNA